MLSLFLPVLRALFLLQDLLGRLFRVRSSVPTEPPFAPGADEARGGHWRYLPTAQSKLFYRYWLPADDAKLEALLIAVHGAGAHGAHFWVLGQHLAPRGVGTFALDLRGHGFSSGPRGDLSHPELVVAGIVELAKHLGREYQGRPVFVLGESLGSNLVMKAAVQGGDSMAGVVLAGTPLSPTEETTGGQLLATLAEYLRYAPYVLLNSTGRVIDITGREERVSRDKEAVRRSKSDPLRNNKLSVRTITTTYRLVHEVFSIARKVRLPALLLQGGHDLVTKPEAVWRLAEALQSKDIEVVVFPEAYHDLFFDPDTPKVLDVITTWINRQISDG